MGYVPLDYVPLANGGAYTTPSGFMPTHTIVPGTTPLPVPQAAPVSSGFISDTVPFVSSPAGGGTMALPSPINPIPVTLTQPSVTVADIYSQGPMPAQATTPAASAKPSPWIWVGVGALALVMLSKKKSSQIGTVQWEKLIIPGAIITGGYIVLKKLGLFGSAEGAANNAAIESQVTAGTSAALHDLANSGIRPTLNGAQLASLAADIYNRGVANSFSVKASQENQNYIVDDIYRLRNTADMYALKQAFGTKKASAEWYSTCALFGFNCPSIDLDTWLRMVLDSEAVTNINDLFALHGIAYTL